MAFPYKVCVLSQVSGTHQILACWLSAHNLYVLPWLFRPIGCEEVRPVPSMTELKGQAAPLRRLLSGRHWLWIPAVCTSHHFYDKEGADCGVCRILLEKPVSLEHFIWDHFSRLRRHCSLFQLAVDFPQADNSTSSFEPNCSHLEVSRSQARAFVFFKVAASLRSPACSWAPVCLGTQLLLGPHRAGLLCPQLLS